MKKGRLRRNTFSIFIGIVISLLIIGFDVTPNKINNYTDIISAILSISSITTGLLFATFTLIPGLPNSNLLKTLKELKTDKKLLDRLLLAICGFLLGSLFALVALFFNPKDTSLLSKVVLSCVGGLISFSFSEQFKVLRILMKTLEKM
ncbi:hypothetical protein FOF72_04905 [Lactobacillus jensenii]|uniref:Uncharacterized protein n=1 Tax=Lactobacillus mulieris TaxID=2508708 RepID=A0AAP3GYF0_9LACO|nr:MULTISPECIES: hypothetical protein [Lactobacillus]MCW8090000.1 hypothetical protein [Lactobacillus jensenii]MCZ3845176.1 hypothetical protein [Lactobacillus mulieris]MCZ3900384.1 hypothetical protein [Lactobacillus mulieris]MDK6563813.1 hypothetical protein [Lactobacillus mulieris]MDK8082846.1 hypothetical protein [Lactobacillus mulieris]